MQNIIIKIIPWTDIFLAPLVFFSGWVLKLIRMAGVQRLPLCKKILIKIGVFPIRNHYYEPMFDMSALKKPLSEERNLPGINWNIEEQLELLKSLSFADELKNIPNSKNNKLEFHFNNAAFESGDAEYWYQLIRMKKPERIFEIGSGNSTLMAIKAIGLNKQENPNYHCKHVCIEPYEMPWLEKTEVTVMRKKVEDVEISFFDELSENDILFIDSSHIIRPEGDVLFEYLELLPALNKGVIVHVHDIFSPRNYLETWLNSDVRFWNEQYLLEAFLSENTKWKIIGSLNYLHHSSFNQLKTACPYLTPDHEPGSFYMQKIE